MMSMLKRAAEKVKIKNMIGISFGGEVPLGMPRVKFPDKHCHFIGKAREICSMPAGRILTVLLVLE
jgi:hypothetical protein